jgi:hypothetical protein
MQFEMTLLLQLHAAHALLYGDPGSGSLIWQLLLAAVFGLIFYVRYYTRRVREAIRTRGDKQDAAALSEKTEDAHAAAVESRANAPEETPRTML